MDSHNERQKALLRWRPMFASLLRGFGHVLGFSPEFMERIDFENIELAGTEFITAEMRERRADLVWKVPLLTLPGEVGPPLPPCFVLTELQSSPEADMLLRLKEYTLLVEQAIQREELRRTLWRQWMGSLLWKKGMERPSFEAFQTSILGGGPMPSLLEQNGKRLCEQLIEQGRSEGLERGLERQRAMLSHQAMRRFGDEMSERLSASLARIGDFDRLDEVGEWIVDCETGEELLSRFNHANGSGGSG